MLQYFLGQVKMTKISVKAYCAVALVLVLVHISVQTCEAASYARKGRSSFHDSSGPRAASLLPSGTPKGVTYRPPIVNFKYQGGRIMWKPVHIYFVWYGTWTEQQKKVVRTATSSLTPKHPIPQWPNLSNMYKLVTEYFQELPGESRKYASKSVTIAGEIDDAYSFGHTIDTDIDPVVIIANHIANHSLPEDYEQGIYFLFTSGDVTFQLAGYCGYHYFNCNATTTNSCSDWSNKNFIYAFVPLPSDTNGLLVHCSPFNTPGVNNYLDVRRAPNKEASPDGGLDGMTNIYIHELLETIVDPYGTAWLYNVTENSEVEDLCEFNYAAGDWWYCYVPSIYPDFPTMDKSQCRNFPHVHTLVEPKSKAFFNVYGNHGSQFLIQKIWSLEIKGCATQPVENCAAKTVVLHKPKGTIQKGLFFGGVGLQVYAPGQSCKWKILVLGAEFITLYFETVALTYDELDYITVGHENVVQEKLTGFGKNIKLTVSGDEANIHFNSYGGRSPQPESAGFILHYAAGY